MQGLEDHRQSYQRELVWIGVIALVLAAVLGRTLYADFVQWDDDINIYDNPGIRGLDGKNLLWMFTDASYVRRYMPLGWLTWTFLYEGCGLTPAAFHLGNLLVHWMNAVLVFLVLRHLLGAAAGDVVRTERRAQALWAAAAGALFWAVHPLRVEVVAWASGLLYCQATFFLLAGWLAYLRYTAAGAGGRRAAWYGAAWASYCASLLTYPVGLGWVVVLVLVDFYPLRRLGSGLGGWASRRAGAIWLEKVPFIVATVMALGVTLWSRAQAAGLWKPPVSLTEFDLFHRVMQAFYVWGCYVWRTWWPVDLSPLYTTLLAFDPNGAVFWLSLVLVVGVSVWLFVRRDLWPAVWVSWLGYLLLLVPMLGLTEHPHYPNDRYSHLAGLGWAVVVTAFAWKYGDRARGGRWAMGTLVCLVSTLAILSFRQCGIWRNSETLFVHMIRVLGDDPYRCDLYQRLGDYRLRVGEFAGAEAAYREVLRIRPRHMAARVQLGNALVLQGNLEEAVPVYERVLEQAPQHRNVRFNLGQALAELGRLDQAESQFRVLVQGEPGDAEARVALARLLARRGRIEEGLAQYREAQRLDPDLQPASDFLARVASGRPQGAPP